MFRVKRIVDNLKTDFDKLLPSKHIDTELPPYLLVLEPIVVLVIPIARNHCTLAHYRLKISKIPGFVSKRIENISGQSGCHFSVKIGIGSIKYVDRVGGEWGDLEVILADLIDQNPKGKKFNFVIAVILD